MQSCVSRVGPGSFLTLHYRLAGPLGDAQESSQAVLFDFNHRLAGQPATFEVHLIGVL